jgi:hypothetical protein
MGGEDRDGNKGGGDGEGGGEGCKGGGGEEAGGGESKAGDGRGAEGATCQFNGMVEGEESAGGEND